MPYSGAMKVILHMTETIQQIVPGIVQKTMMKTYCLSKAQGMIARKVRALILKDRETIFTPLSPGELQLARKLMVAGSMDQTQEDFEK